MLHNLVVFSGNSDSEEGSDTNGGGEPVPVRMKEKPKPANLNLDYESASDNSEEEATGLVAEEEDEKTEDAAEVTGQTNSSTEEQGEQKANVVLMSNDVFVAAVKETKSKIPDSPEGTANAKVQTKIAALLKQDSNFNQSLQNMKQFHNGKIATKIMERIKLQQYASNLPSSVYDQQLIGPSDGFEQIAAELDKAVRAASRPHGTPHNSLSQIPRSTSGNVRRAPQSWEILDSSVTKKLKSSFDSEAGTTTATANASTPSFPSNPATTTKTNTTSNSTPAAPETSTHTASADADKANQTEQEQSKKKLSDAELLAQKRETALRMRAAQSRKMVMGSIGRNNSSSTAHIAPAPVVLEFGKAKPTDTAAVPAAK